MFSETTLAKHLHAQYLTDHKILGILASDWPLFKLRNLAETVTTSESTHKEKHREHNWADINYGLLEFMSPIIVCLKMLTQWICKIQLRWEGGWTDSYWQDGNSFSRSWAMAISWHFPDATLALSKLTQWTTIYEAFWCLHCGLCSRSVLRKRDQWFQIIEFCRLQIKNCTTKLFDIGTAAGFVADTSGSYSGHKSFSENSAVWT